MVYSILGILVGILTIIQVIFMAIGKKERFCLIAVYIVCGLGFTGSGIGSFFIPKDVDYIPILCLLFFAILYLAITYIILKKRKTAQQHKIRSGKE